MVVLRRGVAWYQLALTEFVAGVLALGDSNLNDWVSSALATLELKSAGRACR